jgi:predicted nucleic-acid-binding protein
MITKNNENKYILLIPKFSFFTLFSNSFLNRQSQLSYVVQTALFKEDFKVDLDTFIVNIRNYIKPKKSFHIIFIAQDLTF